MIAGRQPSPRKCSAACRIAWSNSGCSNSFMSAVLFGLPFARARQPTQESKIEPGERIQRRPQSPKDGGLLSQLFTNGAEQRARPWRFGVRDFEKAFKAASLGQYGHGSADGFFRWQLAGLAPSS